MSAAAFEELGIMPELIRGVEELGWSLPTPVQADAVPLILGGGDVLAAAETGSGKTGAFALPVLQAVAEARAGIGASSALPSVANAGGGRDEGGGGGASPPSSRVKMSTTDRDPLLAVSADGLAAQSRSDRKWSGGRATAGVAVSTLSGEEPALFFFEVSVRDEGLARVGWSLRSASLDLGTDAGGVGYGGTGKLVSRGRFENFGEPFARGDVVGCALDARRRAVRFYKNGKELSGGGGGGASEVGLAPELLARAEGGNGERVALYPTVSLKNAEVELNFGERPFAFPPPGTSIVPLADAPAPSVLVRGEEEGEEVPAPPKRPPSKDDGKRKPLALVLEPLKDLAEQTATVFESIARYLPAPGVSVLLLVGGGGPPPAEAKAALRSGAVDVVVGTLGRVSSAVEDGTLDLSGIRFLVLDEADRLVDGLNGDATLSLAAKVAQQRESAEEEGGSAARLQTLFFSATLHSRRVEAAAARLCPRALRVDLKGAGFLPLGVDHLCARVDPRRDATWLQATPAVPTDRVHLGSRAAKILKSPEASSVVAGGDGSDPELRRELLSLALKKLKARLLVRVVDAFRMPRAVVFCRTNFDCVQLARFLSSLGEGGSSQDGALARAFAEEEAEEGDEGEGGGDKKGKGKASPSTSDFLFPRCHYSCAVLGGARTTDERREALRAFKDGDVRFLVATDAAARGIDVAGLPYCVNFSLPSPECSEDYVHRVGRVGRAGARGLAVSLVAARGIEEKAWFVAKKGYRPWEESRRSPRAAADRELANKGGHATWLDESESLDAVCERLQEPVRELGAGLEPPEDVRERVEATARLAGAEAAVGGEASAAAAAYGAALGDEAQSASALAIKKRLEELAPAVKRLAELEDDAQASFLELQERWR